MTAITFTRLIEMLLLPPAGPLLLALGGIGVARYHRRLGYWLAGFSLFTLYLLSTPIASKILVAGLEPQAALTNAQIKDGNAGAIVVIAGPDGYYNAPEYGGDSAGPHMLTRLRYAANLHHQTQLPIAVIGGDGLGRGTPAAQYMEQILRDDFKAEVRWVNGQSRHTFDNARYTREVLAEAGIETAYLVTHAWHMRRAQQAFNAQGLTIIAAPTSFTTYNQLGEGAYAWIPRTQAMELNNRALHEWLGILLARLFD